MRATALGLGAILFAFAAAAAAEPLPPGVVAPAELQAEPAARGKFQLARLFDFAHYRQLFNKRYNSALEELNRRRLFAARAIRAYVSGLRFKFRQEDHYESLNHLSDNSEAELALMRNELIARQEAKPQMLEVPDEPAGEAPEKEEAADKLAEFSSPVEGAELEFKRQQRVKRETEKPEVLEERELPQLINVGVFEVPADHNDKAVTRPASNSQNDEQPSSKPSSGLKGQQEDLSWFRMSDELDERRVSEQLYSSLAGFGSAAHFKRAPRTSSKRSHLPDTMFLDHTKSGCMFAPRAQGRCGSCYAFVGVTIMEWLHCKETGELVAFSEQYFLDCGTGRFNGDDMNGCKGGTRRGVGEFIHNYGMELRANYPYKGRESQCPYDDDDDANGYDLKKTGHIRMELGGALHIPQAQWERFIAFQPLYVSIKASRFFAFYGGGVDSGAKCREKPVHAMVLVGHGRQDGLEFWLLRNSFSTRWGEAGYYKLAKAATRKCLHEEAMAFGTRDGRERALAIKRAPGANQRRPVTPPGCFRKLINSVF